MGVEIHEAVFQRAAEHLHGSIVERKRQVVAVERELKGLRRAVSVRI